MTDKLTVGELEFELRRSTRRRTVGITVERDGHLTVAAPKDAPLADVKRAVRRHLLWVYGKLTAREVLLKPRPPKEFVSGEGFLFRGRSFRLRLDNSKRGAELSLSGREFVMARSAATRGAAVFREWCRRRVSPLVDEVVRNYKGRIGVEPTRVVIRDLRHRWGSCSPRGVVYINWRAAQLSLRELEYVVAHELVHVREPHHNRAFWRTLSRVMPDYMARRRELAEFKSAI